MRIKKPSATKLASAGFVVLGLFLLWRADVVPGVWDLRHWGEDVEHTARQQRTAHRASRLADFTIDDVGQGAVVFIGSSTIERMPVQELFPKALVHNRGIGDEPAAKLLARINGVDSEANNVDWSRAAAVVIYAASVDFRRLGSSPAECHRRASAVIDAVTLRAPGAKLLVFGLLSQRDIDASMRKRLDQTNDLLRSECAQRGIDFLSLDQAPLSEGVDSSRHGSMSSGFSADRLHLNHLGYQVMADWIRKKGGAVGALLDQ